jgi:hypothetical protein
MSRHIACRLAWFVGTSRVIWFVFALESLKKTVFHSSNAARDDADRQVRDGKKVGGEASA